MHRSWLKDYLSFTRKERNAVLILVLLIILTTILPHLLPDKVSSVDQAALEQFRQQIALLKPVAKDSSNFTSRQRKPYSGYNNYTTRDAAPATPGSLFYFDPNTLPEEGWKKLGLPDRTIRTIKNYLEKGGKFRHPEDIGKIYSLKKTEADRLMPYVRLSPPAEKMRDAAPKEYTSGHAYTPSFKPAYADLLIDINHTDTTTLQLLPGIGSKLAARILTFKDKLGGFYSVEQIAETYGLPDSTYQKIKSHFTISTPGLTTININTAGADQLKQHPYIRWSIANAIVEYRRQHGNFSRTDDLLQIAAISPEQYKKLLPYLTTE